ncbi:hypothetical protein CEE37_05645 [candidate division LCP-89 bacterium B3_LCP]|uniref:DUF362 domain-containing protein n=1 Tax=candidate division LCP-89 bacterium B3_LCP TaxID=2012998 RepID=A0A532V1Q5_UNCL8|nr:MAG: hypothetical protein CEE37_05645 [candidate division LCP-89 bacterium B3_LCP]
MLRDNKSRRDFIKSMLVGTASTASLMTLGPMANSLRAETRAEDPREGLPNPFVNQYGHPILVCVEGTDFEEMLAMGLSALGGLDLLIDNNQDVLIKPNLVHLEEPYPTISDPNSVLTLLQTVQQVTSGAAMVGDSSGFITSRLYEAVGLDPLIPNAGGGLVDFDSTYEVRRSTWEPEVPDFMVYSAVYDSPIILNLCSLKRHDCSYMTCALKNHVGTVGNPGPADTRDYLHDLGGLTEGFLHTVAEIYGLINSELVVVDARQVVAINGPFVGSPYFGEVRDLNKIVICGDQVAADAYCAQLLDGIDETFDPTTIEPTLTRAEELGLGTADLSQVEIIELGGSGTRPRPVGVNDSLPNSHQCNPNPFNASTTISFTLPKSTQVRLSVHDITGRTVKVLSSGWREVGINQVIFDASRLSSGSYIYQIKTPEYTACGKLVLVK